MKTVFNFIFCLLLCNGVYAQNALKETNGRLLSELKYENLIGDPNLYSEWKEAVIKFKNGKTAKVPVNVDLIAKVAFFKGDGGSRLGFVDELSSIVFKGSENSFAEDKLVNLDSEYYLVIAEGKTSLYKKLWKTLWEEREHNSATVTKTVVARSAYYILGENNKMTAVKANKSLIAALPNHKSLVEQFVKKEQINFNNDSDLRKFFDYYNSL